MSMQVLEALSRFIRTELSPEHATAQLTPETLLVSDGFVDSLGTFHLVAFIEDYFHVEIDPEDIVLENFGTLAAIDRLIRRKRSA